jgi:catechol 2,3-dioxygenase-like lactoylglutathione lyase family enzyme
MGLRFMEHMLILTDEPEATRDWWVNALGFREGDHPEFGFPVYWLYIGDQDVIHIGKKNHSEHQNAYLATPSDDPARVGRGEAGSTGPLDHVCFNCEGIEEFVERLEANGVDYSERQAHNQALYQLFFREPINGIKVELNFPAAEAQRAGRQAARTAGGAVKEPA